MIEPTPVVSDYGADKKKTDGKAPATAKKTSGESTATEKWPFEWLPFGMQE